MRINSRKNRKILGRVRTALKRIFETFCTQEPLDALAWMQHSQLFIWFRKSNNGFPYTIFPVKKNKCWKNFKIMRKSLFNYSHYSHPEIGNFRVWQIYPLKRNLVPRFEKDKKETMVYSELFSYPSAIFFLSYYRKTLHNLTYLNIFRYRGSCYACVVVVIPS
jgi:hypothetical protein